MYKLRTLAFLLVGCSTVAYGQFEDQVESGIFKSFDDTPHHSIYGQSPNNQTNDLYRQYEYQQHLQHQEYNENQMNPSNGQIGDGEVNFFNQNNSSSVLLGGDLARNPGKEGDGTEDSDYPVAPINDYILLLLLFAIALGYKYHKKMQLN